DGVHVIVNNDSSGAEKYGNTGLITLSGLFGLLRRGFASKESKNLEWNPAMDVKGKERQAIGIEKAVYLQKMKKSLGAFVEQEAERAILLEMIEGLASDQLAKVLNLVAKVMGKKKVEVSLEDQYNTLRDADEVKSGIVTISWDVGRDEETPSIITDDSRIIKNTKSLVEILEKTRCAFALFHSKRPAGKYVEALNAKPIVDRVREVCTPAFLAAGMDVLTILLPFQADDNISKEISRDLRGFEKVVSEQEEIIKTTKAVLEEMTNPSAIKQKQEEIKTLEKQLGQTNLKMDLRRLDLAAVAIEWHKKEAKSGQKILFSFENIRSYASEQSSDPEIQKAFKDKIIAITGAKIHVNAASPDMHRDKNASINLGKDFAEKGGYFLGESVFDDLKMLVKFEKIIGPKLYAYGGAKLDKIVNAAGLIERIDSEEGNRDEVEITGRLGLILWGLHNNVEGVEAYVRREFKEEKAEEILNSAKRLAKSRKINLPVDGILRTAYTKEIKGKIGTAYRYEVVKLEAGMDCQTLNRLVDVGPETIKAASTNIKHEKWKAIFYNGASGLFEVGVKEHDTTEAGAERGSRGGTIEFMRAIVEVNERALEGEPGYVYVLGGGGDTIKQVKVVARSGEITDAQRKRLNLAQGGGASIDATTFGIKKILTLEWARKFEASVLSKVPAQVFLAAGLVGLVGLAGLAVAQLLGVDLGLESLLPAAIADMALGVIVWTGRGESEKETLEPTIAVLAQRVTVESGAKTGEVPIEDVIAAGATAIIAGHSEARGNLGDTDLDINQQLKAAIAEGLKNNILCVGETDEEKLDNYSE
ncbi:phosphoglycerate kinase, partial [bacterium]|nr:phosphoglycerate kinase [bacterium]